MDIRQLRVFLAIYEHAGVSAAATRLHLTQPSISASLQQLEETLGVALFERMPRGMRPTQAGQRLYPQARRLVAEMEALRAQFDSGAACIPLQIGVEADVGAFFLQEFCRRLGQLQPAPQLTLYAGCAGEIRLGLAHQRCSDESFFPLWREDFMIALPPGHALAAQTLLQPQQLAQEEWVVCLDDPSHISLSSALGPYQPAHPLRAANLELAAALVAAGQAIACLPPSLAPSGVLCLPLAGLHCQREVGLSYHPAALQQPGPAALLALCGALHSQQAQDDAGKQNEG
ncbi:LysR family transcriptional regulator [Massilia sp. W12]|uniref:LysR family transcriptional regulator n=1 Tax=Massilia sp. W12 TaxID=3126507 RepID=UPI0030CA9E38